MSTRRAQLLASLNKATIDRPMVGDGNLNPTQSAAFIRTIKDKANWLSGVKLERRTSPTGVLNKIATGGRLVRPATENNDDGYRAGAEFPTIPYHAKKLRLPWEVTEDAFHENIEGENLESVVMDEMTQQFGLDLEDLAINGDEDSTDPMLKARDGILKRLRTLDPTSVLNAQLIHGGEFSKATFFAMRQHMPNRYITSQGDLEWVMSPARAAAWWELLTDRNTAAGDSALVGWQGGGDSGDRAILGPLGIPIRQVEVFPDNSIMLSGRRTFHNIITWDIRRRRVTGETDHTLAALDKRFYIFFIKQDVIYEEGKAIVLLDGLDPIV